jgi:hypothetical protein
LNQQFHIETSQAHYLRGLTAHTLAVWLNQLRGPSHLPHLKALVEAKNQHNSLRTHEEYSLVVNYLHNSIHPNKRTIDEAAGVNVITTLHGVVALATSSNRARQAYAARSANAECQ